MPPIRIIRRLGYVVVTLLIVSAAAAQPPVASFSADVQSGCAPLVVHFQDSSSGHPAQWTWDLGNGTISHQQHPSGTYFNPGTYAVKLVVRNAAGADSIVKSQFITVYANPLARFSVSDSSGCFPLTVRFTDQSVAGSGSITRWTWDFGDGNVSNDSSPVHTYTRAGSYHVTLKVTNSHGCQKTITRQNLIQLQPVKADFVFSSGTGCAASNTVGFNQQATGAILYRWDFGDGSFSQQANPAHSFQAAGTYLVKLVVKNATGCEDSITRPVVVGMIKADFIAAKACAGSALVFQNTSTPSPLAARWDFGDGSRSTDIHPSKIYALPGTYQVRLISDFGGCLDTVVKPVVVHSRPSAAFTQTGNLAACQGPLQISFNATVPGLTYHWSFGDGTTASGKTPSHTFQQPGVYDVRLVATNASGCSDTVVKQNLVRIIPPRITRVSGHVYQGCTPYTANLSADVESTDPVIAWRWYFGDGTESNASHPSHQYALPGSYTIKLVITTAGGCRDSVIYPATIQVSHKPTANFTAQPRVVCAAGQVQFTNQSVGGIEWSWDFGDGGFSSDKDPIHQFGDTGVFTIRLIASSTGCSDTLTIKDYVRNDPPIGRFNLLQNCSDPYQVQFRDSSIGGQSYKWYFGDGDSSTLRHPGHRYKTTGDYPVRLIVYHGACSYTVDQLVRIIDERPVLKASDSIVCRNLPVTFTADNINPANIVGYSWDFGDGAHATTQTLDATHAYRQPGSYQVTLVTMDALGCRDTALNKIRIRVFGPTAAFGNIAGTCVNSTVAFLDSSAGDGTHPITAWSWNYGNGIQPVLHSGPFSHLYTTAGTYDLSLKVTDSYGCVDSVLHPSALIITNPAAAFLVNDSVRCASNQVSFTNQSTGLDLSYAWDFGDGQTLTDSSPSHAYSTEGVYNVSVTVTDRFGCTSQVVKQQVISNPRAVFTASDTFSSCPPLMVNLVNRSTSAVETAWDFGDGSTADVANPSHYYNYPGSYRLKLTVKGFGTCIDTAYQTILIKGPTGSFLFNPDTICTNGSVTFHASTRDNARFFLGFQRWGYPQHPRLGCDPCV